jgi:hypothetical protein
MANTDRQTRRAEMQARREARWAERGRPGIFFPLMLIGVGIVLLLSTLGIIEGDFWGLVWTWFPLIFIVSGLDGLLRGRLIGGVLWIGVGLMALATNLGYLPGDVWTLFLLIWPVFILAAGVEIILGRGGWIGRLAGALVIAGVLAGVTWVLLIGMNTAAPGDTFARPAETVQTLNVNINAPVGRLGVAALKDSKNVIEAKGPLNLARSSYAVDSGTANYSLGVINTSNAMQGMMNAWVWQVGLNPNVKTNLDIQMGAASATLDLNRLNIGELNVRNGVGQATVILPERGNFKANIQGAVGQTTIIAPRSLVITIRVDHALAGVSAPKGWLVNGKSYSSPNQQRAEGSVEVDVSQAVGLVVIREK